MKRTRNFQAIISISNKMAEIFWDCREQEVTIWKEMSCDRGRAIDIEGKWSESDLDIYRSSEGNSLSMVSSSLYQSSPKALMRGSLRKTWRRISSFLPVSLPARQIAHFS